MEVRDVASVDALLEEVIQEAQGPTRFPRQANPDHWSR